MSRRSLSEAERQDVLDVLYSDRFVNQAPREIWAKLMDEGKYLCSISTMYRILRSQHLIRERRACLKRKNHEMPILSATGPN